MNKRDLKKVLRQKTSCTIQHNGWPCGTCFGAISDELSGDCKMSRVEVILVFAAGSVSMTSFECLADAGRYIEGLSKRNKIPLSILVVLPV